MQTRVSLLAALRADWCWRSPRYHHPRQSPHRQIVCGLQSCHRAQAMPTELRPMPHSAIQVVSCFVQTSPTWRSTIIAVRALSSVALLAPLSRNELWSISSSYCVSVDTGWWSFVIDRRAVDQLPAKPAGLRNASLKLVKPPCRVGKCKGTCPSPRDKPTTDVGIALKKPWQSAGLLHSVESEGR